MGKGLVEFLLLSVSRYKDLTLFALKTVVIETESKGNSKEKKKLQLTSEQEERGNVPTGTTCR